jgi:hypothetical protein
VNLRTAAPSAIRVIRFTRRIALQCMAGDSRLLEWAVCDTIANGSRRSMGRRGAGGGAIVRFERTFTLAANGEIHPGARKAKVAVVGELARDGCVALRLLVPAGGAKIWNELGFLNRAGSK